MGSSADTVHMQPLTVLSANNDSMLFQAVYFGNIPNWDV
jgi:hypothetical protein